MVDQKGKIKKDLDDAITVAALNNLDTPEQILQHLHSKKKTWQMYSHLCNLVGQRARHPHSYLTDYLYPANPLNLFSEDWDGSLPSGYFEQFSHRSLLPYMVTQEVRHVDNKDPISQLMLEKTRWKKLWHVVKRNYIPYKKKYEWLNDDVLVCPEYFVETAKVVDSDPDEYLDAPYNWYYAGKGNLQLTTWNGSDYVIHSEFHCLYVTPFTKENPIVDSKHSIKYECDPKLMILETIQSNDIIALRTKFKVILLKIRDTEDGMSLELLKNIDSTWAYTSISFDEFHTNILFLTTIENQLTIINLDRMKGRSVKLRGKLETLTDNWNSVISSQRECYLHINPKAVTFYDKRTNEPIERWKGLKYQVDIETCNEITAATYCMQRPQLYLASTHHLFLLDLRYDKMSKTKPKSIQRWNHGMRIPPTYFSICEDTERNKDMICFSSQWLEDMTLLTNHSDILERRHKLTSIVFPYKPPSLFETLKKAQLEHLCCDLSYNTRQRLVTSISGLAMYKQKDDYVILMQNSLGDISQHSLHPSQSIVYNDNEAIQSLNKWSRDIKCRNNGFFSNVYDLSVVWKKLRKIPDDFDLGRKPYKAARTNFNEQEIYDIFEKGEVDPQFLEVWKTSEVQNESEVTKSEMEVTINDEEDAQVSSQFSLNYNHTLDLGSLFSQTLKGEDDELPDEF